MYTWIFSVLIEEHETHLQLVSEQLRKFLFFLQEEKCQLYASKMDCLSHLTYIVILTSSLTFTTGKNYGLT